MVYQFFHGSKKSDLETRIGAQLFVREGKNQQKTLITFFLQQHSVIFYISESLSSILIPFLLLWFIKVDWFFDLRSYFAVNTSSCFFSPFFPPFNVICSPLLHGRARKGSGGGRWLLFWPFISYYHITFVE